MVSLPRRLPTAGKRHEHSKCYKHHKYHQRRTHRECSLRIPVHRDDSSASQGIQQWPDGGAASRLADTATTRTRTKHSAPGRQPNYASRLGRRASQASSGAVTKFYDRCEDCSETFARLATRSKCCTTADGGSETVHAKSSAPRTRAVRRSAPVDGCPSRPAA